MDKGWIKIYRQIQDCCIWQRNEPFDSRSAWIDLLLTATHSERKLIINNEVVPQRFFCNKYCKTVAQMAVE